MVKWNRYGQEYYNRLWEKHRGLWTFVKSFIDDNKVPSVLEIGGGDGRVGQWITGRYVNVELNDRIVFEKAGQCRGITFCEDWVTMDLAPLLVCPPFDLVLACGVMEHCEGGYGPFLDRALSLNPRFILISFLLGLSNSRRSYRQKHGCWMWHYSHPALYAYLQHKPQVASVIFHCRKWESYQPGMWDDVMVIESKSSKP